MALALLKSFLQLSGVSYEPPVTVLADLDQIGRSPRVAGLAKNHTMKRPSSRVWVGRLGAAVMVSLASLHNGCRLPVVPCIGTHLNTDTVHHINIPFGIDGIAPPCRFCRCQMPSFSLQAP